MDRLEDVRLDDCMEISVHEFKNKIDIDIVASLDHIEQLDHIIMTRELLQECNCITS